MGWWKIQGTDQTIGDIPLDALGEAVSAVVAEYQSAFGRRPTKLEWEAMLRAVLGNEMPEFRCMDEGVVERVTIEVE
jgi:hypothetical protein